MTEYDRAWLRGFLRLDARAAEGTTVPARDVERQEDTVMRALALLDCEPGVVLADEVGMGKTYEALGVIAARTHSRPEARTLILTPGPDLNTKWVKELDAFGDRSRPMYAGFRERICAATTLAELVDGLHHKTIVVAPVSIFAGGRSNSDQAYLLCAWADSRGKEGPQHAAMFRRYRNNTLERVQYRHLKFLSTFDWVTVQPALEMALEAHKRQDSGSLDHLWESEGYAGFEKSNLVDGALADLRFRILGGLVPELELLVVDEAHKLKNPASVRATGVRTVFEKRFNKALFLTATPFQLTVDELGQVFSLFGLAKSAPSNLHERSASLLEDIHKYTKAYDELDRVWRSLDGAGAADFEIWFGEHPDLTGEPENPTLRAVVELARELLALKQDNIEPKFRAWMIRSLREDKRKYRKSRTERLRPTGANAVPFLLYERFIAELFRTKSRTHKAAVQINMVSSFGAAREGALLSDEVRTNLEPSADSYRTLLQKVVGDLRGNGGSHPKIAHVVRDVLTAAEQGEKTLIFCARVETLHELKQEIEGGWDVKMLAAWQRVYPGATDADIFGYAAEDKTRIRGRHARLQGRFQSGQDELYLALRERYVATLLDASEYAEENLPDIVRRANDILARLRLHQTHAKDKDWSILKRCIEQATALALREAGRTQDVDPTLLENLCNPAFLHLGIDLVADEVELSSLGDCEPTWKITIEDARPVIVRDHLWNLLKGPLCEVPAELRVRTVERLAGYLVSRYLPFLADLLTFARDQDVNVETIEARTLLPVVDRFWTSPEGRPWCDLLKRFLVYAGNLDEARRREVLDDVVKAGAIVRHTVDGESRERLREAFNTPLYPMVLVANEVMQEGLDLHHHCRRVIHHDLAWNPAQLEQRVGRVDRLGSLVQRMRVRDPEAKLEISLPLIVRTIDERLERTVRGRERWLEFLLGAPPKIEEFGLADEPTRPLPAAFAEALKVELGPRWR